MQIQETIKIDGKSYPRTREMTPEEEKKFLSNLNQNRVEELKQQLADTDYKAIKYAEGWMSEEEYEPIRLQRQEWREEINRLQDLESGDFQ